MPEGGVGNRVSLRFAQPSSTAHAGLAPSIWERAELSIIHREALRVSQRLLSKAVTAELRVSGEKAAEFWDGCGEKLALGERSVH